MKPMFFALAMCGVAAACVPEGGMGDNPFPFPVENACGADQLQYLVSQPASVLATMRFRGETRFIRPNTAVTMDFRADRLNIDINAAERITRVYCT
jgi:hypothetical protein